MKVVDSNEVQWHTGPGHRGGGIYMRDLLLGEPGADNYWLVLNRIEGAYDTPLHSHAFEQVRIMLEGRFNFGAQDQEAGTIGYFCEGTPYEQQARGESLMLLLQCEGGSRTRYTHVQELYRGAHELRTAGGVFQDGLYTGPDGKTKDGYDAVWEHLTGEEMPRPSARFQTPVIMQPAVFNYVPVPGNPLVAIKNLGVFNERQLTISMLRIGSGATYAWTADDAPKTLFFVQSGDGTIYPQPESDEPRAVGRHFAIELSPGETATFSGGQEPLEMLVLQLPR